MTKVKLKAYKVRPDDLLDLIDAASCGEQFAALMRCAGGRLIPNGYVCPHCGQDPSMRYDAKGNEVYSRKEGEKTYGKCGAPAKRVIEKDDLTKLYPVHLD